MIYPISRESCQEIGNVYHAYMGAKMAAEAAIGKCNEARAEYEKQLLKMCQDLGIPQERFCYVTVRFKNDQIEVGDPIPMPMVPA